MIEYRVKPVIRYIVTRYDDASTNVGPIVRAEIYKEDEAHEIARALCMMECEFRDEGVSADEFLWPGKTVSPIGVG